jgi:hypothetical protein
LPVALESNEAFASVPEAASAPRGVTAPLGFKSVAESRETFREGAP